MLFSPGGVGNGEGGDVGVPGVGGCVGIAVVGIEVGLDKHPTVLLTLATTASLHCPFMSSFATQKNTPPLHENCPLLVILRSTMTWTAWAALAFEPVALQSEMQKPKTI